MSFLPRIEPPGDHDTAFHPRAGADARGVRETAQDGAGADSNASPRVRAARRDLLERIAEFALRHDLEVTGSNLAVICNALSGSNGELAEVFAAREISGEPIDQRWLNTLERLEPGSNARHAELEALMDQLEYSLIRFAQTAKSAADETSDQRGVLDAQISAMGQLGSLGESGAEMARVIELSRAMLQSIDQVQNAMERSQAETASLRDNLAKARIEADVDHLTRLPNRRAFERRLASASQRAREQGEALCVAFCDIDHFKAVNDTHGHDAGDRVLCAVAGMLNTLASEDCFVARHGGEEFVVLFQGVELDTAHGRLDGVRRAMAYKQLINRDTGRPFGKVTFSGGLAQVGAPEQARDALERADAALYEAKAQGRNRIVAH